MKSNIENNQKGIRCVKIMKNKHIHLILGLWGFHWCVFHLWAFSKLFLTIWFMRYTPLCKNLWWCVFFIHLCVFGCGVFWAQKTHQARTWCTKVGSKFDFLSNALIIRLQLLRNRTLWVNKIGIPFLKFLRCKRVTNAAWSKNL